MDAYSNESVRAYMDVALDRARHFDAMRPILDSLPHAATWFELAGAVASDLTSDVAQDRCAYDRRILLVTLEAALSEIQRLRSETVDG